MRFVHTSDWHVGKAFGFANEAAQTLRDQRLEVITRIGLLAREQDARTVLVAGDTYDVPGPQELTLRAPIERMRAFGDLQWHLIPGNHDAHTVAGPWERLRRAYQPWPDNIRLHLSPDPVSLAAGEAWLLPGVLTRRHASGDPTALMDEASTPEGAIRIGLAHGSVTDYGTDPAATTNRIASDRAARAGLAYLALGDSHRAQSRAERCWYSGTPETDAFGTDGAGEGCGGEALVVSIEAQGALPEVSRHRVGRFHWHRIDATLHQQADIERLDTQLRNLMPEDLGSVLVWLKVAGALSLAELASFDDRVAGSARSALRELRIDQAGLLPRPTAADLAAIDHAGFIRAAADVLAAQAADANDPARDIAGEALQRLYVLHRRHEAGRTA